MDTENFNAYAILKDYIRARVKAQISSDIEGFELIEENEQKELIDVFVIKLFKNEDITIPAELAVIDDFKVLRTFSIKENTEWPTD